MRAAVKAAWQEAWWALCDAVWTTAGAIFGKRTHGGRMVSLGRSRWFPTPPTRSDFTEHNGDQP